ncbi:MAG: flagellin, partial [Proteobacteria bacterium]|nr:flagellin [Pseudomonadota bacterium]
HASRVLSANRNDLETAMARLSSGKRLNSAADDAAGVSVAGKLRSDIKSIDVAVRNINDAISLFQTYDGAASEIENILVRGRELATQMANDTFDSADAAAADVEYQALIAQVTQIADNAAFNRVGVAKAALDVNVQMGAAKGDTAKLSTDALDAKSLGFEEKITSRTDALKALDAVDAALKKVAEARAEAGSNINRLGFALSNTQNAGQRAREALSGVQDTDYAMESAALARGTVLAQAGTAMLAQANQSPQYVLTLLRG